MTLKALAAGGRDLVQYLSMTAIALSGLGLLAYTLAAATGYAPWLDLPLTFGEVTWTDAGMFVQIAFTALFLMMASFLPTSGRVAALERSHRSFRIGMDDVARAYHVAHTADRQGVFTLSSEFDAVRERLAYLRDHPDLEELEGDALEVAAQMSQQARHLADVYSDEKVARAKAFLKQRQEEAERQQEKIVEALHACTEIRKWAQQVDVEESIVASQLAALDEKLQAALPDLGYSFEQDDPVDNIVTLNSKPAAE